MPGNINNLKPFEKGSERARAAGAKGGRAGARKREIERGTKLELVEAVQELTTIAENQNVSDAAVGLVLTLIARVQRGEIEVKGGDVAALAKSMYEIARLDSGQPTGLTAHVTTSVDDMARIRELRAKAGGLVEELPVYNSEDGTTPDAVVESG